MVTYHKLVFCCQGHQYVLEVASMPYNALKLTVFSFEPHGPKCNHWSKRFDHCRIVLQEVVFWDQDSTSWNLCRCSEIFESRYAMLSSLWTGAITSSIMSFRDMSRSHAASFKGIVCPMMNGSSRIRAQFSCAFPPTLSREENVAGNG